MTAVTTGAPHTRKAPKQRRQWKPIFLKALDDEGTVWAACVTAQISRTQAYRARQEDEAFAVAWADVENVVTDKLERKATSLALNGDTKMLEFLLKSRKPDTYTERRRVEHSGTVNHDLRSKTDEELRELVDGLAVKRAGAR